MPSSESDQKFSVAILAGGMSKRMTGRDKAFLTLDGVPFVSIIAGKMIAISDDVSVIIGKKQVQEFGKILDKRATIKKDSHDFGSPVSGMLTACESALHDLVAIVACDLPLVKPELIGFLAASADGRSGAVPIWENKNIEPLCAVYNADEFRAAALKAEANHDLGCKSAVKYLSDVNYVPVSELRKLDPTLESFYNVNSMREFENLRSG